MSDEIASDEALPERHPLPDDFYPREKWQENVLGFYMDKLSIVDAALKQPVEDLTRAIDEVVFFNLNLPDYAHNFLKASVNPAFDTDSYNNEVIANIRAAAEETSDNRYLRIADALVYIRAVFEQNHDLLQKMYPTEIDAIGGDVREFARTMSRIAHEHVGQIVDKIKAHLDQAA